MLLGAATALLPAAWAQTNAVENTKAGSDTSVTEWLARMHQAAMHKRSFVGTIVQSSREGMSSARIWHACDGQSQIERIEALTGLPRSVIRHNDTLLTFLPEQKIVRSEKRPGLGEGIAGRFSAAELLSSGAGNIADFYKLQTLGTERVAGLQSDVVQLHPRDNLRYGYRIWTERKTALVLKLQTLDAAGTVIEQAAFSEMQLDAPVKATQLQHMMKPPVDWRLEPVDVVKTSAAAQGWQLKTAVPGFQSVHCFKRGAASQDTSDDSLQWVFSDGLATVSLFIENYDKTRHGAEGASASGATNSLFQRLQAHFLTVVGEVPLQTLRDFSLALERKK